MSREGVGCRVLGVDDSSLPRQAESALPVQGFVFKVVRSDQSLLRGPKMRAIINTLNPTPYTL